jgi:hypothetical protein
MLEVTIVGLLLFFSLVIVLLFQAIRDHRKHIPLLRPVSDPSKIEDAVKNIIETRNFYHSNTSYLIESRNAVSDLLSRRRVGLILMENVGNSSAVEVEFKGLGDYYISDGPETKLTTILPGGIHSYLFYLPEDMVSDLLLYPVKIKYKSINGRRITENFHVALNPEPKVMIDEDTQLRVYLQM